MWAEHLKWRFRALFAPARIGEGAWQQPPRLWKISGSATLSLFQTEFLLTYQKSATVTVSPHKGDTVPVYQPPVLSRQNVGDPLTKKKDVSKNMFQVSMHNGTHWKSIQCGVGRVGTPIHSSVKYLTHGMLNESWAYAAISKKAGWWLRLQLRTILWIIIFVNVKMTNQSNHDYHIRKGGTS